MLQYFPTLCVSWSYYAVYDVDTEMHQFDNLGKSFHWRPVFSFFFGLFGAPTFCSAAISAACIPSYHLNMLDNMDPCILFNVSHTSQIMIRHWILAKRQMLMVFLPDKHPEWRAVNKHTDDILKYIPGLEEATVVVNMFMLFLTSGWEFLLYSEYGWGLTNRLYKTGKCSASGSWRTRLK